MAKENDRARNELLAEIEHYKNMLAKSAPHKPHYKDIMKHYNKLLKELKDYDNFRGYK